MGCTRKGIWQSNGGDDGGGGTGNPNELASSWIISIGVSVGLPGCKQNQKYGMIPTIVVVVY